MTDGSKAETAWPELEAVQNSVKLSAEELKETIKPALKTIEETIKKWGI